ncbi:MAG TPA: DUF3891 family protein [Gaiellales bacterium]|jgi:hypothetical protein|nr:DUF3891 family protein [Gaiellales bacterium]
MIVHPAGETAEIVMQVDHSAVAGMLASLWPGLEPRESVLTAATLHDIGWSSWEAGPRVDPETGRPQNFLSVDIRLHLEFYEAGIAEVTERDRYAGMLVGKHLAGIYRQRYGTQAALKLTRAADAQALIDEFVARVEQRFLALQRELGVSDEEFWRNYVLLQVFDRLSLWLCKGDPAGTGSMEIVLPDDGVLTVEPTPGGCALSPYPLDGRQVQISVPVRVVPLTGYANDADCAATILSAPIEQRVYSIDPG